MLTTTGNHLTLKQVKDKEGHISKEGAMLVVLIKGHILWYQDLLFMKNLIPPMAKARWLRGSQEKAIRVNLLIWTAPCMI